MEASFFFSFPIPEFFTFLSWISIALGVSIGMAGLLYNSCDASLRWAPDV